MSTGAEPAGTRLWVDPWDPSYLSGVGDEGGGQPGGPAQPSTAQLDLDVEVPAAAWAPMPYPAALRPPDHVLLVDGVRRRDAVVWTSGPDGAHPGLAASYAAGVVHCDLRAGRATLVIATVERGLFTTDPTAPGITGAQVRYPVHRVAAGDLPELDRAAQGALTDLEVRVAGTARARLDGGPDLLVVDGPLERRTHLPRALGYVKSHRRQYLPPAQAGVVTGLAPGQRSPVFRLGTSWHRYTWYLRLPGAGQPGGSAAPWSGLARAECAADLPVPEVTELADLSVATLPRFAASAYKDPRAPQNLVPIAGLEQRLRARLGDAPLLQRALRRAAAGPAPPPTVDGGTGIA